MEAPATKRSDKDKHVLIRIPQKNKAVIIKCFVIKDKTLLKEVFSKEYYTFAANQPKLLKKLNLIDHAFHNIEEFDSSLLN